MIHTLLAAKGPLEQLLSQPQLFVFLFAAVAWVIKAVSKAKSAAERPAAPAADPAQRETFDEARARRVREDILRKVAERQIRRSPPAMASGARRTQELPPTLALDEDGNLPQEVPAWRAPQGSAPVDVKAVVIPTPAAAAVPMAPSPGAVWLEELRTRDTIRKSIIVREILGPPLALR